MNGNVVIPLALLVVLTYSICRDLVDAGLHAWYCRKAQYNCELCRYWTCPAHYCNRKRAAIEECNTKIP